MKIKNNVHLVKEETEAILFDFDSLTTILLNETSIIIWENISKSVTEITNIILKQYDNINECQVEADVMNAINEFKTLGFILDKS